MKFLVPVVILAIIAAGVFALLQYNKRPLKSVKTGQTTTNVGQQQQQVPVTGNPDDVNSAIIQAATNEKTAVSAEDIDAASVSGDSGEASAVGDSVNENEF